MKKIITLTILCFFLNYTEAQTKYFKGLVLSENGSAIPFATVNIYSSISSTKTIINKITSEDGSFIINTDSLSGSCIMSIAHISYNSLKQEIDFTNLSEGIHTFSLTEKVHEINEITITEKSQMIYRKRDKVIMNVQNNPLTVGKNVYSLIQMAPGVFVMNNQISINGEYGTKIYINDKPLRLIGISLHNYLNSLQARDIKSIEIKAHTSAENDAEGSGGILNIILKKPIVTGISGYLGHDQNFGLGKYPTYNPFATINLKTNKLQLSAGYVFLNQKDFFNISQDRSLADNGVQSQFSEETQRTTNNDINIAASYDITKKQNISVYCYSSLSKYRTASFGETNNKYTNNLKNNTFTIGNFPSKTTYNFYNTGFNYEWITDKLKSKILIVCDYTYRNSEADNKIENKTYNYTNQLIGDTIYNYISPNTSKIYTLDARYKKVFQSGTELIFGGKIALTNISTINRFEILENDEWINSLENAFNYSYKEHINSLFSVLSGNFLSVDYKVGIRAENSYIKGFLNSYSQDSVNIQKYLDLFPSVFIGRALDKTGDHYLSLSYNKRIGRPGYSMLNPYKYYTGNYSVASGNPYLEPSYIDVAELGYTFQNTYYFGLSYSNIRNQINKISKIDPSNTIIDYIPENIGNTTISKLTITAPLRLTKWWNSNNSLIMQYIKMEAPEFSAKRGTFAFQSYNEYQLKKCTSINFGIYYNLRSIYGNTITKPFSNVSIGINQRLFNDKLIVNVNIWDLFYRNNPEMISYYGDTQIHINKKYQTRLLMLSLRYNFKLGKIFKTKQIVKSNDEEKNRLR